MAEIWVRGRIAYIDDEDLPLVKSRSWYLVRYPKPNGKLLVTAKLKGPTVGNYGRYDIRLHELLTGSREVIHLDGNTLNNRRSNLEPTGAAVGSMIRKKRSGTSSKYKGVYWHKQSGKWHAKITIGDLPKNLGFYKDEIDAAKAYDKAARELFGKYARPNFKR